MYEPEEHNIFILCAFFLIGKQDRLGI